MLRAVDDVSFEIGAGETLGLVGESGCGKTTVGRLILRLLPATGRADRVRRRGRDPPPRARASGSSGARCRWSSRTPTRRSTRGSPSATSSASRSGTSARRAGRPPTRVAELLDTVGLPPAYMSRYPHAFSGGQRQRIGIARALALGPRLLVCDEAVSSLDVSVQAQILNLLADLQRQLGLALLFISHNLAVVRHVSHRVAVMYLGRLVELAPESCPLRAPPPPVHARASGSGARGDPRRPAARRAPRRDPEPARSADGLPLPDPLPPG